MSEVRPTSDDAWSIDIFRAVVAVGQDAVDAAVRVAAVLMVTTPGASANLA